MPVASFFTVTLASGMGAWEGSVTIPWMALENCASAGSAARTRQRTKRVIGDTSLAQICDESISDSKRCQAVSSVLRLLTTAFWFGLHVIAITGWLYNRDGESSTYPDRCP